MSGNKPKRHEVIEDEVERFIPELQQPKPKQLSKGKSSTCPGPENIRNAVGDQSACKLTANATKAMFDECKELNSQRKKRVPGLDPIHNNERKIVIDKAKRSLAWARDPGRAVVPGAENMTEDQVW